MTTQSDEIRNRVARSPQMRGMRVYWAREPVADDQPCVLVVEDPEVPGRQIISLAFHPGVGTHSVAEQVEACLESLQLPPKP